MWLYKEEFNINDYLGFVYIITNIATNKKYIGKKFFFHTTKQKVGKKELAAMTGKGRRPTKKIVIKESDWKNYHGSNEILKEEVQSLGNKSFRREIIRLCKGKRELTYWETKLQFQYEVLEKPDEFYNSNILGSFYTKDIIQTSGNK